MEPLLSKIANPLAVLIISFALVLLGFYPDLSTILGGIALFLIGMEYMESGFRTFSGGFLEQLLKKFTNNTFKAITTGFVATAVVQSSSLISVIIISFLGAGLISLSSAIGVIFGSNIGTTATAWLVSLFGLKIKISAYAMPMIVMGIMIPLILKKNSWKGIAAIFIGLGIIFLGISYMKEGFETLKEGIDLAAYAMDGYRGIFVYVLVGAIATVVIQSSSATMALIITALASGQIEYANALALAIGANLGTTVTAVLGALKSNENGKRLAVGHFIFNMITGFIAIALIYQLTTVVDILSAMIGIGNDDYALKLALFHTIFNVIGVVVCAPFIPKLVVYLEGMFIPKAVEIGKARYLNESALTLPDIALTSISKEVKRLFTNSFRIIAHGINIKRSSLGSEKTITEIMNIPYSTQHVNIQELYELKVKNIYGEIIDFSTKAQANMNQKEIEKTYKLKLASRHLVEAIKDTKHLQKNLIAYSKSSNKEIQSIYFELKKDLVLILQKVYTISKIKDQKKIGKLIDEGKELSEKYDQIANETLDKLIRNGLITHQMATSFMNDSAYVYNIGINLLRMCETLFVEKTFRKRILIEDEEIEKIIDQNEKEIL